MISAAGIDRAEDVGHVRKRDQLRALGKKRTIRVEIEQTVIRHRYKFESHAAFRCQHVPRDKIAVMFHLGQDDQIARFEICTRPGICNEIDGLGRVARVNDLMSRWRIDKLCNLDARLLVHGGRFLRKHMHAAMDVGVGATIKIIHRFDDRLGLLRRRRGIKINHFNAGTNFTVENGKVFADLLNVKRHKDSIHDHSIVRIRFPNIK